MLRCGIIQATRVCDGGPLCVQPCDAELIEPAEMLCEFRGTEDGGLLQMFDQDNLLTVCNFATPDGKGVFRCPVEMKEQMSPLMECPFCGRCVHAACLRLATTPYSIRGEVVGG